jgi:hypothetical protein
MRHQLSSLPKTMLTLRRILVSASGIENCRSALRISGIEGIADMPKRICDYR